jgi:transmembrane sensor
MSSEPLPSGADLVEAQAADWLQRRHFWKWSAQDQAELDRWLNDAPAHLVAYLRLEAALNRADRVVALRSPLVSRLGQLATRNLWPTARRIVAAIVVTGAIGVAAMNASAPRHDRVYSTAVGEKKVITLPDGSRIELNTGTSLRLAADGSKRMVWLDKGEAYFQIRHDAINPFTVITGDHRVVDLGTRFLIRKDSNAIEVSLVEGRARVDTLSNWRPSQSALLTPGDVVIASAESMSLMKRSTLALSDELSWRRGQLIFRDTPLATAAAEFNRYNTRKIVIADEAAALLVVGGTFPSDDANNFVRAAQRLFKLHVEVRDNETVITR